MVASTFAFFNCFMEDVAEKVHNLGSDTLKVLLTNTAPVATNTVKTNITEITAGNGYTEGGETLTVSSSSQSSGTYKLVIADKTITASGGSIGSFRYAVIYNDTSTSDSLIGWVDYGSSITLNDTEPFTLDFDGTNGLFTLAVAP
ncbi:hypothetical protein [Caudoviricetes sp.]|nr:hypothetical protein [Caudoviricetes sp.]